MNALKKVLSSGAKNTNTTLVAVIAAAVAILTAVQAVLDDNPETNPDWNNAVTLLIVAATAFLSRDADKSSRSTGVES